MTLYVQSKFEVIQVIIDRSIERERETEREKREERAMEIVIIICRTI